MPITGLHVSLFLYVVVVLALLIAELREDRRAQFFFKPLAAFGFVILALQFGALETVYGKYILAALMACAVGDVLLLSRKSEKLFMGGMAAFALGHIIYSFGFLEYGLWSGTILNAKSIDLIGVIIFLFSTLLAFYFVSKSERKMRLPIFLYTFVIAVMVSFSFLTESLIIAGAIMFAISDIFVAKDRFVKRDPKNAFAITPLYFGAQALFALSVSI